MASVAILEKEQEKLSVHVFSDDKHTYDVSQMWISVRDQPIIEIKVSDLEWELSDCCWDDEQGIEAVTPHMVLARMDVYPTHAERIRNADMSWPIVVKRGHRLVPDTKICVLDGMHRLARAFCDNYTQIDAQFITEEMLAMCEI